MKKLVIFLIFIGFFANAQIGGSKSFRFLEIPMTARAASLGGNNMSIWGDDINLLYSNPSLLNPSMSNQLALNYSNYVGDLKFGYLAYAKSLKKYGTLAGSIQFYDYGTFSGYNELGQKTADFKANDYSLNLNYAKPLADSLFNIGISIKTIISQYDIYKSYANAIDFGVTYRFRKDVIFSLLVKNVGVIWKSYTNNVNDNLPQTVQLGASFKPSKAPFRLFAVYDQLLKWKINYVSPIDTANKSSVFNNSQQPVNLTSWEKFKVNSSDYFNNFMQHFTFGTEVLLTKNFNLRIAYNYRRQQEFSLPDRRGINGLSLGFGIKVKRFGLSYSFSKMAFPGNSSVFGISTSL